MRIVPAGAAEIGRVGFAAGGAVVFAVQPLADARCSSSSNNSAGRIAMELEHAPGVAVSGVLSGAVGLEYRRAAEVDIGRAGDGVRYRYRRGRMRPRHIQRGQEDILAICMGNCN